MSTENYEFEAIDKFKAFMVKRDTRKRVDVDKSFLLVKTDVLQNSSNDLFLYRETKI